MIPVAALEGIHTGRPAAVLGGGPSLRADFARVPECALRIAVNHHALRYGRCEILVFQDDPERRAALRAAVEGFPGLRVSRHLRWTQVDLTGSDWWMGVFSSHSAAWLACFMGCNPVLLAGMDCYQGGEKYAAENPDADERNSAYRLPLELHLRTWREALSRCPNPGAIRAMSGPLASVFGDWQPDVSNTRPSES